MAVEDLTSLLDDAGVEYEVLLHAHTESALAEAEALGLDAADVAKTLVVTTPEGYLRAVVPASERLDLKKLREVVGGAKKRVHLATEDDLARDYAEFELGAVPPLGGARRDRVVVDSRVAERDSVVIEAGSHDQSLRVSTDALLRLTGAGVADVCVERA
jgi:Ala-tRNA(Pro) deacylase